MHCLMTVLTLWCAGTGTGGAEPAATVTNADTYRYERIGFIDDSGASSRFIRYEPIVVWNGRGLCAGQPEVIRVISTTGAVETVAGHFILDVSACVELEAGLKSTGPAPLLLKHFWLYFQGHHPPTTGGQLVVAADYGVRVRSDDQPADGVEFGLGITSVEPDGTSTRERVLVGGTSHSIKLRVGDPRQRDLVNQAVSAGRQTFNVNYVGEPKALSDIEISWLNERRAWLRLVVP